MAPEVLPQEPSKSQHRQASVASFCHIVLVQQIFNGPMERFLLFGFSTNQFLSSISYNKNGMVEHKTKYTYTHKTYVSLSPSNPEKKNSLKRRRCMACAGTYITCVHVSCHRSFFYRLTVTDGNGVACAAHYGVQEVARSGMARSCHASL